MLIMRLTFLLPIYQVISHSLYLFFFFHMNTFCCWLNSIVTISVEASWRKLVCGFNYNEFRFGDFIIKCICHFESISIQCFLQINCVGADADDDAVDDVVVVVVVVGIAKHNKLHSFIHIRYSLIHNYRNV